MVRVWHDNSGSDPSWFLRQIVIKDIASNCKRFFLANQWLAVDEGDGKVDRHFHVANAEQIAGFKYIFYSKTTRNITDGHLWMSVFMKPSNSSFSRAQRLTCCLTVLYTAMIANAMFYEFEPSAVSVAESTLVYGPFEINLRQLMVGIQSSVVVVPINVIIMFIFKNSKPPSVSANKPENKCSMKKSAKYKIREEMEENNNDITYTKPKSKFWFPHWFVFIAYLLSAGACVSAAFFTVLYSIQWGKEKANQWLASVVVSLVQDIFFMQPVKIVILALFFALLIRHPAEDDDLKETGLSGLFTSTLVILTIN